jgi:DNA-binding response OmpR family regulator
MPAVRGHPARFFTRFGTEMTQPTRILIVSDCADQQSPTLQALARAHFETIESPNFTEAYTRLLDSGFDLIVIERAEPARDSIEFIKRVRATPQLTAILILIVAEWGTGEPTLALRAGADAYEPNEVRPFDPSRLVTSIERLLNRQVAAAN